VSAGSRFSPQLAIVGAIGKELGLQVSGFVAQGAITPIIQKAIDYGVNIHQVRAGYSVVVQARARQWASENNAYLVPFGMADESSFRLATVQSESLLRSDLLGDVKRIVLIAGSGVNMIGVLRGMSNWDIKLPVLAVLVGHNCRAFVSKNFSSNLSPDFVYMSSPVPYSSDAVYSHVNGVEVDARYEGKAVPFLRSGDLFWVIGHAFSPGSVSVSRVI
jgi:1-aminocyclopropane-1-carboxylate deaminase/D-cysteine desulfhydrase-like pyridoxal-dependent ACC family enzyme